MHMFFHERKLPNLPFLAVSLVIAFGFAMNWWSVPPPAHIIFGVGAFALAVNLLEAAPQALHHLLSLRPLRQLGLWSFSIHLWQQSFYLFVHREGMSPWVGVSLAILTGIVSFNCLEKPVRAYLNRVWFRQQVQSIDLDNKREATVKPASN